VLPQFVEEVACLFKDVPIRHVDHCNPAATGDAFCAGNHFEDVNKKLKELKMAPIDWLPCEGWANSWSKEQKIDAARMGKFIDSTITQHQAYLQRLNDAKNESLKLLPPITGILNTPLFSLKDACAPLLPSMRLLAIFIPRSNQAVGNFSADELKRRGLTPAEAAALHLYTTECGLYRKLNRALRDPDRAAVAIFRPYLKLLITVSVVKISPLSNRCFLASPV
jgi:hypothetical protein